MNLTMRQALGVWSELESAYYGENGFGGDTAEIYAYRLQQRDPTAELAHVRRSTTTDAAENEQACIAADNLTALITIFLGTHDCEITIDGAPWSACRHLVHRCHVKVERK